MYRGSIWGIGGIRAVTALRKSPIDGISICWSTARLPGDHCMDPPRPQIGFDSDQSPRPGEVGRVGVAIDTLRDVEILFDGIPLHKAGRVFTTANAISPIMMAMLIALAEKQGVPLDRFIINIQNDILKEFVARGTYIFPLKPSLKLSTDVMEWVVRHHPQWRSITVCGSHMRQAGANAVQEAAFAIANAIAYVESCLRRGLEMDHIGPR